MPGKPGGGGGGGSTIFTTNITGPPPGGLTATTEEWIELGTIPTGKRIWFGTGIYLSPDKTFSFEIRGNLVGESAGTLAATEKFASTGVSSKKGTVVVDYYKKGRLHIVTVISTGVEKFWIRLFSRKAPAGSYLYTLLYTEE